MLDNIISTNVVYPPPPREEYRHIRREGFKPLNREEFV